MTLECVWTVDTDAAIRTGSRDGVSAEIDHNVVGFGVDGLGITAEGFIGSQHINLKVEEVRAPLLS